MGELLEKDLSRIMDELDESAISIHDMFKKIEHVLADVAETMHIGKLTAVMMFPINLGRASDESVNITAYEYSGGYSKNGVYSEGFTTPEQARTTISIYTRPDYKWTMEDQSHLHFLAKFLYVVGSKTRMREILERMNNIDGMTGIYNQLGITTQMAKVYATGHLADYNGIFLNVKNMKYLNNRYGGLHGDACLRIYAQTIKKTVGDQGMVARLGGDNFFVFVSKEKYPEMLEFLKAVSFSISLGEERVKVTINARMGVYIIEQGDDVRALLNRSSLAFNGTRVPGAKEICIFENSIRENDLYNKSIIANFKPALAKREFVVLYQPKVALDGNVLCGAEALARWVQNGQIVLPAAFVPILERFGCVSDLDFYVLEQVCKDLRDWIDRGLDPVKVSINLSRTNFINDNLVQDVLAVMNKYQISRDYIEIEITESSSYEDYDKLLTFVQQFRDNDIKVSIDDFGTGFSSLSMLTNLNVDIIKLDKSFLDNVTKGHGKDEILFRNIMQMINDLGLTAVAEGVEELEQVDFLKSVGCNIVQGFHFDRPLFKEVFEERMKGDRVYKN